ncbi:hypothetical protein M5K25_011428 [Dendrobium thyrsiflorum]|uniref:CCHC-type domain-containing protein n=1 Tax=Dendrobium thyrsiflorum TaxID=117978 RepID=A0ABD0V3F9_DENTH
MMIDRQPYTYHRRKTTSDRAMDPERDVTDDNTDEVRSELPVVAEPPSGSTNATLESFTQMMAAMTQLIKSSQTQASGSGSAPMDKYLKLFHDMRPPFFSGGGPIEAENWLMRIENIIEDISCPEDRKVTLAVYAFEGEAERWWQSQLQETFGGRPSGQIFWGEFVKVFKDWFIPLSARRQMQDKFIRLVQGDQSIMQYEAEFTMLSRYASQLIPNAEEKCHRFLSGLKDIIRQPLIPLGIEDYSTLVESARRIELDLQATQRRRDFQKRKNEDRSKSTQSVQLGRSTWKKPRPNTSESSIASALCNKCGKTRKGECLSSTNTCYWCHQPGHMAKSCPILGQRSVTKARTGGPLPQKTAGRPRTMESTTSVSSQGQTRATVQPRVYGLSQREAKDSPDVITGLYMGDGNLKNEDKLILRGLQFYGFHGVHPEEKEQGQKFLVDIDAWLDLRIAGETDDITDTVSYTDIYSRCYP